MTIAAAWVRRLHSCNELVFAADSLWRDRHRDRPTPADTRHRRRDRWWRVAIHEGVSPSRRRLASRLVSCVERCAV